MTRKELFRNLLVQANEKGLFVGTGNPEANILIVGKEASIAGDNKEQIDLEIKANIALWMRDIDKQPSEIENCIITAEINNFSPLYPYKGQVKKRDSRIRNPNAAYNWGTSPTWLNYQKLRDAILETNSEVINFHENVFITELNQITSRYSSYQDNDNGERERMIVKRQNIIFSSGYIKSFPVVILACGAYIAEHRIDVGTVFGVEQNPQEKCVPGNPRQWYKMYRNLSGNPPKLVIHTRQLSLNITDALLGMVGKDVADFCIKNNISLE